ncbi:MAG: hypothetical protein GX806_06640, partial [Lentisphaerae bacterium]|nr:hypothetical protein [Lentisphaerota bacterium]
FPDRRRGAWLALAAALLVAGLGLQQRTHLVAVTDYKGLARFLRPFAERIISEDGILLCEYSRLAAPFEHFFGIPTLGLDNERQDDYTAAELAWQEIMRQDPQRAAFFITPFHQPVSDLFSFELLHKDCYQGAKLLQARRSLPTRIGTHRLPLRLYRMQLTPESAGLAPTGLQYDQLDAGNMGLRGFANIRRETAAFDSWYSALSLAVLAPLPDLVSARLSLSMQNAPYLALKQLLVSAPDELAAPTQPDSTNFMARWARARAQILVPPELGAGYLVLLLKTPRLPTAETKQVRFSWSAADLMQWQPPVDKWQWLVVPLPAAASGQWLSLACEPAWDPQLSGYPADLGVLIGMISFWPAAEL